MNITSEKNKKEIRIEINKFMLDNETNLKHFCETFGYKYSTVQQRLVVCKSISVEFINEIISKLDSKKELQIKHGFLKKKSMNFHKTL